MKRMVEGGTFAQLACLYWRIMGMDWMLPKLKWWYNISSIAMRNNRKRIREMNFQNSPPPTKPHSNDDFTVSDIHQLTVIGFESDISAYYEKYWYIRYIWINMSCMFVCIGFQNLYIQHSYVMMTTPPRPVFTWSTPSFTHTQHLLLSVCTSILWAVGGGRHLLSSLRKMMKEQMASNNDSMMAWLATIIVQQAVHNTY